MPIAASPRSSSSSSRRPALAAAALAAAALLLSACGGGSSSRNAVRAYLTQVGHAETALAGPLARVNSANQAFAKTPASPQVAVRLARSQATLARLHRRLAALHPPPQARHLHALLLELVARESQLAGEVTALARFLPRYQAALAPVAPASRALATELGRKSTPAAGKAAALHDYGVALAVVEQRVRALHPPPVSAPGWRRETAMLAAVRTSGDALAAGLLDPHAKNLPQLLRAFDAASAANRTVSAQRAQIAAVRAYDTRIAGLERVAVAIQREQRRVTRSVA